MAISFRRVGGILVPFVLLLLLVARASLLAAGETPVPVYLFWQQGCPYCAEAKTELRVLSKADPSIQLQEIEVGATAEVDSLFEQTLAHFRYEQAAVPLVVIGDRSFLGFFADGRSTELYRQAVKRCLGQTCPDPIAGLIKAPSTDGKSKPSVNQSVDNSPVLQSLPQTVQLPILGQVRVGDLSLPVLTILLAGIDGFNPCAMWVLVFLIGLLLGLKDEKRMWLLGAAFLGATAVMYFVVMAAWLNLILFLGVAIWVRAAIGLLAIGGGIYFLREYWTRDAITCKVTNPGRRQKIMDAFRSVVNSNQLMLSVLGIMALAVVVNLVELLCSAGIPAVYTQVLALSSLPAVTYYAYIGLYISVFMLDDIAIFATAMLALRVAGLTGTYVRYSNLIGGTVLLAIGAILLLRPELLTFS